MITIVTITYNNFLELKSTLESIQPLAGIFETLVINGGSCRETKQYLYENKIHHISESDQGISDAFNKGIENSRQPFIWFINSGDQLINPSYGIKALEQLSSDPTLDYIYGNVIFQHTNLGKIRVTPSNKSGDMPFPHPSLIMRKKLFSDFGKFDLQKKVAMDYEIAYRLLKGKYKGLYLNLDPVVLMDGTGISSKSGVRGLQERREILKKLELYNWNIFLHFFVLDVKSKVRNIFERLGILGCYDLIKRKKKEYSEIN